MVFRRGEMSIKELIGRIGTRASHKHKYTTSLLISIKHTKQQKQKSGMGEENGMKTVLSTHTLTLYSTLHKTNQKGDE